ncbi:tRNA guanosine(34) transglycosylase Tgt [Pleomorphochaeta sp. DL1XJH-081]|jgi:queuine tRNA-ribosyltransferase|uniref:tRNA guanosine(34) transglycosylase Tgt n=1 Tax=Pleomorphochaeta sp. DL1XJH-081 TaxID=3409690 RepID=UPI003BB4EC93
MEKIYQLTHQDTGSDARCGIVSLPHGDVITPTFMPVGTNGTVKGMYHDTVADMGYNLILGNTYHLYLRPGIEVLKHYGGLHKFSNWNHNILTDSGGFQIFSLSQLRKIREEGVVFQSHIDGSRHHLTPEKVVDIQHIIGSDILMCLDVCTPPEITYKKAREAWEITRSWAKRSYDHWRSLEGFEGKLFGIIQGNFFKDLRKESALAISEIEFPGIAIGGLSVGETPEQFSEFLGYTTEFIPKDRPRYVMGIGTPDYILDAVENGIDLFDCVLATRAGRNGSVFTDDGMIQMKKAVHEFDTGPIVEGCTCTACTKYSRGYVRHLFKAKEMLGGMLATEHNLTYLYRLMDQVRSAINENRFSKFKKDYLARYYGN